MKCVVCDDRPRVGILLCAECAGAFDRWAPISDETEASVIAWAARRTRRAERQRLKAESAGTAHE